MDCLDITQTGRRSALRTRPAISPALLALPVAFLMLTLYSPSAWAQVTITAGDIVVVDANASTGGNGSVIRIDPTTGAQTIISDGQLFREPVGIAIEAGGTIVVTDRVVPAVIRVDPRLPNGSNQTKVNTTTPFIDPFGITIGAGGIIYITDTGCVAHATNCPTGTDNAKVFSVNPATGAVTLVSSGEFLRNPFGIEAEGAGTLVVTDSSSAHSAVPTSTTNGGIIRIAPATGVQTVVHAGTAGADGCPFGITVDPFTGDIFNSIFDSGALPTFACSPGALWKANPVSGANTDFSPHTSIAWLEPFGMKVDTNPGVTDTLLVVDEAYKAIYRVNTTSGAIISFFNCTGNCGFFVNPTDVDVYTSSNTPPPLTGADLSVTKSDGLASVTAGDGVTHTYTITVRNNGPLAATGVNLTDTWPTGFIRGNTTVTPSSQGTCTSGTGSFTCSLGTLALDASVTISADYTVPSTTPPGDQINQATVSSSTSDPNTENNTATDTTTVVTSADLMITKTDGVTTVTAGDGMTRTYTMVVTNRGPSQATGVMLTDTWPGGFIRGTTTVTPSSQGSCPSGTGSFTCSLGNLAAGASATVTANYTVPATTTGSQTNTVTVSSSTPDSNSANNTASDMNTVNPPSQPPAKWTGGGQINVTGGKATFGFTVERKITNGPIKGQLEFLNHVSRYQFKSISISTLTVTDNRAEFTGTGQKRIDGGSWSGSLNFRVVVYDFGDPGKNDRFRIEISDGTAAGSETEPIKSGNIKQHN